MCLRAAASQLCGRLRINQAECLLKDAKAANDCQQKHGGSALSGVGALKSLTPIATPTFARQNQVNDQGQQCKNHQIKELGFVYHMTSITPSDVDLAAQIIGQLWVLASACSLFAFPRDLSGLLDTSRVAALKTNQREFLDLRI